MPRPKPLYTMYLRPTHPDVPPAKNRHFQIRIIGKFDNTVPGAEMAFVYGER